MTTISYKRIAQFRSASVLMVLMLILGLLFSACGEDNPGWVTPDGGNGTYRPPSSITARMETPRTLTDGSTVVISHDVTINGRKVVTYELEYDKSKFHSRWVAFRFDGDTRGKIAGRKNIFMDDPSLSTSLHIGNNGFGSGYDRGHLCSSEDRVYNQDANDQTFYMSNMSPQKSSFNEGYWVTLEQLVQKLGRDAKFSDTLYVVKGGTIRDDQLLTYVIRPNGKQVAVPKYYYMALLKVKNGVYSSIAFWMEHKEYGYTYEHQAPLSEIRKTALTVNELEQKTGIDFFPNLPNATEEKVENQKVESAWGM